MFEKIIVVGSFQCNSYLLVCSQTGQAVLIDPGDQADLIVSTLKEAQASIGHPIQVKYLIHTHAHLDHIGATRQVCSVLGSPPIALHREDELLYQNLKKQGELFQIRYENPLPVNHYLEDGERLDVGSLQFQVIHTPGHSPGSISLQLVAHADEKRVQTVYSGDTLFKGSIGRTDLWGGNSQHLLKSIQQKLFILDEYTRVCPGHGPSTTIGLEKIQNPYVYRAGTAF